eukprot:CAMPEP_0196575776 /NCGR_PEP_ID=MMETSP1081-20130531/5187_1 /TAXON_ID=36882 /ORGANISM="Pyramimonas amylifera, Strain CCMP720" /LENGTH=157 /DNA_ID=CAMNT_0041894179 /DNA_START=827 /DNA_END=1300 /DNA_ORIENTATION=-
MASEEGPLGLEAAPAPGNIGAKLDYGGQVTFRNRFPDERNESLLKMLPCMLSQWKPNDDAAVNTSGQFYLTEHYIYFSGTLKRKKMKLALADIVQCERSTSRSALKGVRLHTKNDPCIEFTATSLFGGGDDIYELISSRLIELGFISSVTGLKPNAR